MSDIQVSPDVAIIGSGPGGYVAAIRCAQLGLSVTLIERDVLGGTCLNWGCIPSKALIQAANLYEEMAHASTMGIQTHGVDIDIPTLQEWKSGIVQKLTGGIQQLLTARKVEILKGTARFTGPNALVVEGNGGTRHQLTPKNILLATGSSPIVLPHLPLNGTTIVDSKEALSWDEVPKRLAIIGGGVIGLEIGMVYAKLGAQVTIIEMMGQLLPGMEGDIADLIARSFKKRKIQVYTHTKAEAIEELPNPGGIRIFLGREGKPTEPLDVDKILVSVGRKPNSQDLGLELAGIQTDSRGFVQVDPQLRTTNPNVYAIGDLVGGPLLAHKASKEGLIVADILSGAPEVVDYRAMPAAVFTDPEVATVGWTEAQAIEQGYSVKIGKFPFQASGRALSMNHTEGFVKVIADAKTDRLLGVHMAGPHVSELIGEAALALEMGATAEDIALTVHTHPTLGESLMEAAEAVHDKAIHIYNPKRGTPGDKPKGRSSSEPTGTVAKRRPPIVS